MILNSKFHREDYSMTMTMTRLTATPAQRSAVSKRVADPPPPLAPVLNAAQIAGNARRAAQRAVLVEERAAHWAMHSRMLETRREMATRFPLAIMPFGEAKIPLAIGIDAALFEAAPDINRHDLFNAIADYTAGSSYLRAMVAGVARIDLDGVAVGVVTSGQEAFAKMRLAKMKPKEARKVVAKVVATPPSKPKAVPAKVTTKVQVKIPTKVVITTAMKTRQITRAQRLLQQTTFKC